MTNIPVPDFDLSGFTDDEYEMKLLLHKPKFISRTIELRKKWSLPDNGFENNQAHNLWVEETGEAGKKLLFEEIRALGFELQLSERWDGAIYEYLQTNSPYVLRAQSNNPIRLEYDDLPLDRKNVRSVWVQVDSDTTEKEMLEVFHYAKELFGENQSKKQRAKNLDADLQIWRMYLNGFSIKQITQKLLDDDSEPRALSQDDIGLIIRRLHKRLDP